MGRAGTPILNFLTRKTKAMQPKNLARSRTRGATMVEYALLLVAVLLLAAAAFKALGPLAGGAATRAGGQL